MINEYFDISNNYIPYLEDLKTPIITPKEFGQATLNSNKFKRKQKHKKH